MTQVSPIQGGQGQNMTSFKLPPITYKGTKTTIEEIKVQNTNLQFYDPSLTHKGRPRCKSYQLSRLPAYGFLLLLNTFEISTSNNKGDIRKKHKVCNYMTPVGPIRGVYIVNLTNFLSSLHTVPCQGTLNNPDLCDRQICLKCGSRKHLGRTKVKGQAKVIPIASNQYTYQLKTFFTFCFLNIAQTSF